MRFRELGESNRWSNSDILFDDPNGRELKMRCWRYVSTAAEAIAFVRWSSRQGAFVGPN